MPSLSRDEFCSIVDRARNADSTLAIPISIRLLADGLTPVLAYRRLVRRDERTAPSFLLESIEVGGGGGGQQSRYSILGADPAIEVVAHADRVETIDHRNSTHGERTGADPFEVIRALSHGIRPLEAPGVPACFRGGWVGNASYDSVRYAEPTKLAWSQAPEDDRGLADMQFGLYDGAVVFDHVENIVHVVVLAMVRPGADAGAAYDEAVARAERRAGVIESGETTMTPGRMERDPSRTAPSSNLTTEAHAAMVSRAQEYIRAGDIFQVVVGQRFERVSRADPFDVYRTLRAVNPSPYMVYLQGRGQILVASSPEILCRVRRRDDGAMVVTNRPLAGTRVRGATPEQDAAHEADLMSDPKERAEHSMLVDLGRNDVGRVASPGSVRLGPLEIVERYSHVMHISSTVTGTLRDGLDGWDALRAALPVGTISGAPKVRAMQIIDELEPARRGPYGGGMGWASLDGEMDIALALRTIVVPVDRRDGAGRWTYHLQAAGGIVAESNARDEYEETVNKAAAMSRAIDAAEAAFGDAPGD